MSTDEDYDFIFKLILIGDSGVGKSNILTRYVRDEFKSDTKSTVGVEFGSKRVTINNTKIKAQIWDTAGQERYRSITSTYYKGSIGAFIVYDISQRSSFEGIDRWYNEMKNYSDPNISIILVGNKCDLEDKREVSKEAGQSKAKALGMPFFETSALMNIQIDLAFNDLIEDILLNNDKNNDDNINEFDFVQDNSTDFIQINVKPENKNKCCLETMFK